MINEWPKSRFNEANAERAFALMAKSADFDLVKWTLLRRLDNFFLPPMRA